MTNQTITVCYFFFGEEISASIIVLSVLSSSSLSNEPIDLLGIYSSLPKNKKIGREGKCYMDKGGSSLKMAARGVRKARSSPPKNKKSAILCVRLGFLLFFFLAAF